MLSQSDPRAIPRTELSSDGYTLSQVVQFAFQHNPVMNDAEAVLEQSQGQRVTAGP